MYLFSGDGFYRMMTSQAELAESKPNEKEDSP
jgi:hypothetical protein